MFSIFYNTINNDENNAAIKIQKVTRGYLVRKKYKHTKELNDYQTINNVIKDDEPKSESESHESESPESESESESESGIPSDKNVFYVLHVDDKPLSYILSDKKVAYKTLWKYARQIKAKHSIDKRCFILEKSSNELEIVGSHRFLTVTFDHIISRLKLYKVYVKI